MQTLDLQHLTVKAKALQRGIGPVKGFGPTKMLSTFAAPLRLCKLCG